MSNKVIIFEAIEVNRKEPINFKEEDVYLFQHELKKIIPKSYLRELNQPLIINKSKINDYLNLKNNAQEVLQSIKPPNLDFYQIGLEINNPKNNYKELINPLQK